MCVREIINEADAWPLFEIWNRSQLYNITAIEQQSDANWIWVMTFLCSHSAECLSRFPSLSFCLPPSFSLCGSHFLILPESPSNWLSSPHCLYPSFPYMYWCSCSISHLVLLAGPPCLFLLLTNATVCSRIPLSASAAPFTSHYKALWWNVTILTTLRHGTLAFKCRKVMCVFVRVSVHVGVLVCVTESPRPHWLWLSVCIYISYILWGSSWKECKKMRECSQSEEVCWSPLLL